MADLCMKNHPVRYSLRGDFGKGITCESLVIL